MSEMSEPELGGGNIKTPPLKKKTDNFQTDKWIGTFHIDETRTFDQVFELIERKIIPMCSKYIFGEEYADGEVPHIQMAFITKRGFRPRRDALKKLFGKDIYLDRMKGKWEHQSYCAKEGHRCLTNSMPKKRKPLKSLACEGNLYEWQKNICDILATEPDDRTIHWIHGASGGNGKTTFCKYIHRFYDNVIMLSGKSADMKNGVIEFEKKNEVLPEVILINLPRSYNNDYLSYCGIEEIKDMFFYSGKYEGGMVNGNSPHVFIFSNQEPDYQMLSEDRWVYMNIQS